ncbi:TetR family transcriptional regulator [Oceanisphaera profunda]|uniref:TetR family transcriptional regulator n=1 Tax=Oceanisphaera profunda TaxID=1416627 RepID=A0A1Y0D9N3_9GAMM|nr:TetR/AcrR family transcriptional regulator [Oceanisphaera profunda]ART83846.1 TetR family transcriptional regulator [Oceanisphaera profunda]
MMEPAKHLPADERRAVTVDAVIELAAEQNPSNITTTAIAKRMGLTQGALFRHFPTKDAILEAVMNSVAKRLLARIDKVALGAISPLIALEAMFMAHIDFVTEHPGVPRLLFGELQRPGETLPKKIVLTLTQNYSTRLRGLLEAGKAQGELDAQLDVEAAAVLFIGSIQGLVMQSLLSGDVTHLRRSAPGVFSIFCRGIKHNEIGGVT